MKLAFNFEDLISEANKLELYQKLVLQLNKDFLFANIDLDFDEDILPTRLKLILHETLYKLIQEKFVDYLNLLYIIDVSEEKIKQIETENTLNYAEQVVYLILLREWQKVWFRNKMNF